MAKKMLFNATEMEESRVAIIDEGQLEGYYIERSSLGSCLGNIYKAVVTNIEPSIDSAFVDFGGARHGFLHASDVMLGLKEEAKEKDMASGMDENPDCTTNACSVQAGMRKRDLPITALLSQGQNLIVQVTKDGINDKAPTLSTYISLPGRFLVFMPGSTKRGISRKIEEEEERSRLKGLFSEMELPADMGIIVRTAGEEQTKAALQKDVRYLNNLWKVIQKRIQTLPAPAPLYQENDLVIRALRDLYSPDINDVITDSEEVYKRIKDFMHIIMPRHLDRVKLYNGAKPLFERYRIERELESIFNRRIPLKSGGSLVIEQTEALVAIDVNSGKFKAGELEETAFKINIEAANEIARQLKLRDLGGVIISDFIDMKQEKHRRGVEKAFREALKSDKARIKLARMSPFGIIEMTRQRVRPSLKSSVFDRCTYCSGTGYVASIETTCLNLVRKLRLWVTEKSAILKIQVNNQVADFLNNHKRRYILELEEKNNKKIIVIGSREIPIGEIKLLSNGP